MKIHRMQEHRSVTSKRTDAAARVRGGLASALVERMATLTKEWVADNAAHASIAGSVVVGRRQFCAAVLKKVLTLIIGLPTRHSLPTLLCLTPLHHGHQAG